MLLYNQEVMIRINDITRSIPHQKIGSNIILAMEQAGQQFIASFKDCFKDVQK